MDKWNLAALLLNLQLGEILKGGEPQPARLAPKDGKLTMSLIVGTAPGAVIQNVVAKAPAGPEAVCILVPLLAQGRPLKALVLRVGDTEEREEVLFPLLGSGIGPARFSSGATRDALARAVRMFGTTARDEVLSALAAGAAEAEPPVLQLAVELPEGVNASALAQEIAANLDLRAGLRIWRAGCITGVVLNHEEGRLHLWAPTGAGPEDLLLLVAAVHAATGHDGRKTVGDLNTSRFLRDARLPFGDLRNLDGAWARSRAETAWGRLALRLSQGEPVRVHPGGLAVNLHTLPEAGIEAHLRGLA